MSAQDFVSENDGKIKIKSGIFSPRAGVKNRAARFITGRMEADINIYFRKNGSLALTTLSKLKLL